MSCISPKRDPLYAIQHNHILSLLIVPRDTYSAFDSEFLSLAQCTILLTHILNEDI